MTRKDDKGNKVVSERLVRCGIETDEDGKELPAGEPGLVYFERDEMSFSYHNDPEKTRSAQHPAHPTWTALGDVGYVDEDGYLYLTDRASFMIISGGVNIYALEVEAAIEQHEGVAEAAVIGIPSDEWGESVHAFIVPRPRWRPDAGEIEAFLREHIAGFKRPRSIEFRAELPHSGAGKVLKRELREPFWEGHERRLV